MFFCHLGEAMQSPFVDIMDNFWSFQGSRGPTEIEFGARRRLSRQIVGCPLLKNVQHKLPHRRRWPVELNIHRLEVLTTLPVSFDVDKQLINDAVKAWESWVRAMREASGVVGVVACATHQRQTISHF